jgi:FtsP/CotA-like multicopper oxidase with cupredoxin domain
MSSLRSLSLLPFLLAAAVSAAAQTPPMERARANDNRARAGLTSGNVIAVRLEARLAMWHPNGEDQPGAPIPVFAELGRPAQVPGPLIRVPGGTDVIAIVRNSIPGATLTIHGLHARPAIAPPGTAFNDSIVLAPGAIQQVRFRLDRPGTYYYWATTSGRAFNQRFGEDAQLNGAIVVDEPGARPGRDRIFIISSWTDTSASEANRRRQRELFVINGRAWPHTDRMIYPKGETVQWRLINATTDLHPMHLHGFYFRVNRRGDGRADTAATRDLANTERMAPGSTATISWVADRLGSWLFHCHIPAHVEARGPLGLPPQGAPLVAQAGTLHADHDRPMGGLVSAVEIRPAEDDTTAAVVPAEPVKRLNMFLQTNVGSTPWRPWYGVSVSESVEEPLPQSGQTVGPPIVLQRGEPVSILVRNRASEATSIHWHGMELESFFDGVAGFSGIRPQVAPSIAPGDSFEVRFTPPRAGTFIYHSHANEARQQRAGIVGALLVVDRARYDSTREVTVLVSSPSDSTEEESSVLINGSATPVAPALRRASAHRLRLVNITTGRAGAIFELKRDTTTITWRALAKDGAELPAARRVIRPARQSLSIGETADFEFFPTAAGEYRIEVRTVGGRLLGTLPLRVQ